MRACRDTQRRCRWAVRGPQLPVHVWGMERVGDDAPGFLGTSALDLTAAQLVAAWAARFRPEAGCRAHQQRLGLDAGRAWTQEPLLRPVQVPLVAWSRRRLLHARLDQTWGAGPWWHKPAWKPHQRPASLLDRRRLCWRSRTELSQGLVSLEQREQSPPAPALRGHLPGRAA
jgi:hypothetical protein